MPGPRKNLTPLDMKMMGLAFNQGGIINFLGKQPEVTAPVRAQSHADSPPVQLAYITDAEKDLLVKSNIHGSMDGKPNPGPAGLPSLDDFFNIPGGGVGGGSTSNTGGSVGGGGSSGGGSSAEDYGIGAGQAVGGSDSGTVFNPTGGPPGQQQGFTQADAAAQEAALLQAQIAQEKAAVEAAKKAALAQAGVDQAQTVQDTLLGRIKTSLMGGGEDGNLDLTKEEAYANLPAGMHPLRKQYEYLKEKYGPNWANTTQAKVLEGYLSGVPVERGGGLGAKDENYGLTGDEAKEFQSKLLLDEDFMDAENYRQRVLDQFSGKLGTIGSDFVSSDFLKDLNIERLREGLTPDQYFNFRQQLMAADPTAENQLYKSTFPGSSGSGLGALFEKFAPMPLKALAEFLPERDLSGYQGMTDDVSVGFKPLPVTDQDNQIASIRQPGFMPIIPLPDPSQPEDPKYPFPITPPFMPGPGTGIETVFNPMFLGPSFRGSQYTNQGVSPAFYDALRRFA
jgi:hypothetical protein